jgi:hypothetical protein
MRRAGKYHDKGHDVNERDNRMLHLARTRIEGGHVEKADHRGSDKA